MRIQDASRLSRLSYRPEDRQLAVCAAAPCFGHQCGLHVAEVVLDDICHAVTDDRLLTLVNR